MKLREKQAWFWGLMGQLITYAAEQTLRVAVIDLYRDQDTQRRYVLQGKSKTMKSQHLVGLAADLAIVKEDGGVDWEPVSYRALGEKWESLGGIWGGRFGVRPEDYERHIGWDPMHFEIGDER